MRAPGECVGQKRASVGGSAGSTGNERYHRGEAAERRGQGVDQFGQTGETAGDDDLAWRGDAHRQRAHRLDRAFQQRRPAFGLGGRAPQGLEVGDATGARRIQGTAAVQRVLSQRRAEQIGQFAVKRLEFKVGDGEWADTSMVADEVQVRFKLAIVGIAAL